MSGNTETNVAVVVRQEVAPGKPYGAYRAELRYDFFYACAYCSVTELEAAAFGFEIDHYQPRAHGGTDDYENLYWSCEPCNGRKDAVWTLGKSPGSPHYFIRVDIEDPRSHLEPSVADPDSISHRTPTGEFNIEVLDLNCQRLRRIRALRRRFADSDEFVTGGLRKLGSARLDQLPAELKTLAMVVRQRLSATVFDVPEALGDLVRKYSHSELIDCEPNSTDTRRRRHAYLKSIDAVPLRKSRK